MMMLMMLWAVRVVLLHWWEYDAGTQESLRTEYDFCFHFFLAILLKTKS